MDYTIKSALPLAIRDQHFGTQIITYAILFVEPKESQTQLKKTEITESIGF